MGLNLTIRLSPYIQIKKTRTIDIPKVKRVCPVHITMNAFDAKFCSICGSEIIAQDYIEKQELQPYQVFRAACLDEDKLLSTSYMDGVLKPNQYPPHRFDIEEEHNEAINLLNSQQVIQEQVSWFKTEYKDYITALIEAYGGENIEICWGLLHYWN